MKVSRFWSISTGLLGLAVLALFAAFAMLPAMQAASTCLAAGAVVQFELAASAGDLARIFGAAASTCRPLAVEAMDAVNRLDLAAFIAAYTAFCIAGAFFLSAGAPRPLAIAATIAALGAAAADVLETTTLLSLSHALDQPGALLARLALGAWVKFALLGVHAGLCAALCFTEMRQRKILGALLMAPAPGVALAAIDHVHLASAMNGAFALAWIALLALALKESVMPPRATGLAS